MDELIGRLVADVGIDHAAAEKAVGIILDFLVRKARLTKCQPLLAKLPGADALMQKAASESGPMGGTDGWGHGRRHAPHVGGIERGTGASDDKVVIACARQKTGEDTVGEIVGAIPGLAQFV